MNDSRPVMLILAGLVCTFAAVLGGFVLESGNLLVLLQPAELVIICGAAIGILLVSQPPAILAGVARGVRSLFRPAAGTRAVYLGTLKMLYELFSYHRRAGSSELEKQIEEPGKSALFQPYPLFLQDAAAVHFLCDSLRIAIAAGVDAPELDRIMRLDLETRRREDERPVHALGSLADALPGLGIVAAVLGVVVTMQALGGDAAQIGQKVAAALVGTFLGILLCYGVVGPLAAHMETRAEGRAEYLDFVRTATVSFVAGASPVVAAEFARRSIPCALRPSFTEMEDTLRRGGPRLESVA